MAWDLDQTNKGWATGPIYIPALAGIHWSRTSLREWARGPIVNGLGPLEGMGLKPIPT